jgi:hypothetical protein
MKKLLPVFAALALASSTVLASMNFEDVDVDKDGVISPEEAANVEGLDLTTADVNGDGVLSIEEFQAAAAE